MCHVWHETKRTFYLKEAPLRKLESPYKRALFCWANRDTVPYQVSPESYECVTGHGGDIV